MVKEPFKKSEVRSVFKSETETHDLKNTSYRTGSLKLRASTDNGARTEDEGIPKVSFAHPEATTIAIKDITFDTYEDSGDRCMIVNRKNRSVLTILIEKNRNKNNL